MPKKQLFYFALIILVSIVIWYLKPEKKSTITDNNFAVSDTALVSKIFIADRSGATITLDRVGNNWTVNNKYDVPKIRITTILKAIHKLEFQEFVPNNAFETVVKNLATTGVKVEIYSDTEKTIFISILNKKTILISILSAVALIIYLLSRRRKKELFLILSVLISCTIFIFIIDYIYNNKTLIKTYTIGNTTADHKANYMLLAGTEHPSIVHFPTSDAYPSASYGIVGQKLIPLNEWRKYGTPIFKLNSTEIKTIVIKHIQKPEQSFRLNTQPMALFNYKGVKVSLDQQKVLQLLNSFKLLNCESYKDDKEKIAFATPLHELIVNADTLRTYAIGGLIEKTKEESINVKGMYAILNNGELMLIQDYVFNKVLITISQLQQQK